MGDAAVGGGLTVGDGQQKVGYHALERGADEVERRGELWDVAAEIGVEPLGGCGDSLILKADGVGAKGGAEVTLVVEPDADKGLSVGSDSHGA